MTEAELQQRADETALLLLGRPPHEQALIIGDAMQRALDQHGLTEPTPEMLRHVARVYARIYALEQQQVGHA